MTRFNMRACSFVMDYECTCACGAVRRGGVILRMARWQVAALNLAADMEPLPEDIMSQLWHNSQVTVSANTQSPKDVFELPKPTSPSFLASAASSTANAVTSWLLVPPKILISLVHDQETIGKSESADVTLATLQSKDNSSPPTHEQSTQGRSLFRNLLERLGAGSHTIEDTRVPHTLDAAASHPVNSLITATELAVLLFSTRELHSMTPRPRPSLEAVEAAVRRCPRSDINLPVCWVLRRPRVPQTRGQSSMSSLTREMLLKTDQVDVGSYRDIYDEELDEFGRPTSVLCRFGLGCDTDPVTHTMYAYETMIPPGRPAPLLHFAILNKAHHAYIPTLLAAGADPYLGVAYHSMGGDTIILTAIDLAMMNIAADMQPVSSVLMEMLSRCERPSSKLTSAVISVSAPAVPTSITASTTTSTAGAFASAAAVITATSGKPDAAGSSASSPELSSMPTPQTHGHDPLGMSYLGSAADITTNSLVTLFALPQRTLKKGVNLLKSKKGKGHAILGEAVDDATKDQGDELWSSLPASPSASAPVSKQASPVRSRARSRSRTPVHFSAVAAAALVNSWNTGESVLLQPRGANEKLVASVPVKGVNSVLTALSPMAMLEVARPLAATLPPLTLVELATFLFASRTHNSFERRAPPSLQEVAVAISRCPVTDLNTPVNWSWQAPSGLPTADEDDDVHLHSLDDLSDQDSNRARGSVAESEGGLDDDLDNTDTCASGLRSGLRVRSGRLLSDDVHERRSVAPADEVADFGIVCDYDPVSDGVYAFETVGGRAAPLLHFAVIKRQHHRYIPLLLAAGANPAVIGTYRSRPIGGDKLKLNAHQVCVAVSGGDWGAGECQGWTIKSGFFSNVGLVEGQDETFGANGKITFTNNTHTRHDDACLSVHFMSE
jgi:hypothetical protein